MQHLHSLHICFLNFLNALTRACTHVLPCSVPKYIWEAVSHEIGHALGLSHDNIRNATTGTVSYYQGQGDWAPVSAALGCWGPQLKPCATRGLLMCSAAFEMPHLPGS
jgi:hypothetical protein